MTTVTLGGGIMGLCVLRKQKKLKMKFLTKTLLPIIPIIYNHFSSAAG